jgi:hypothetical protein
LRRAEASKRSGAGHSGRSSTQSGARRQNRKPGGVPDSFELAAGSLATSMISTVENVVLVPIRYICEVSIFLCIYAVTGSSKSPDLAVLFLL